MTTQRTHTISITGDSSIALGDLRWLVEQLKSAGDDHKVSVTYAFGETYEPDSSRLSTEVPDVAPKNKSTFRDALVSGGGARTPNQTAPALRPPWTVSNGEPVVDVFAAACAASRRLKDLEKEAGL